jgi:sRNA-binding protein
MGKRKRFYISNEDYEKILSYCQSKHPKLFCKEQVKLLKVGILEDLLTNGLFEFKNIKISKTKTRAFIRKYVAMPEYQQVHVAGGERFDITGKACGQVTALQVDSVVSYNKEKAAMKMKLKAEAEKKAKSKVNNLKKVKSTKASWGMLGIKTG